MLQHLTPPPPIFSTLGRFLFPAVLALKTDYSLKHRQLADLVVATDFLSLSLCDAAAAFLHVIQGFSI